VWDVERCLFMDRRARLENTLRRGFLKVNETFLPAKTLL
jgi:hypothetical protein